MRIWLLLAPLLMANLSAAKPSTEVESAFPCKYDGNQQEMNACALRDYKQADLALNQRYKAVMAALPVARQKSLRQQQRNWLRNRDPRCKKEAEPSEGGSIWQLEYFGCLKAATELRTKAVEQWQAKP